MKQEKTYTIVLALTSIWLIFSLVNVSGSLMAENITTEYLGDLFGVLLDPFILFVIPLILLKVCLKKLFSFHFPIWLITTIYIVSTVLLGIASVSQTYNYFIQSNEDIQNTYYSVEMITTKKLELIPEVFPSIDTYTTHEKEILQEISIARKRLNESKDTNEKVEAINNLDAKSNTLIVNFENYPNLKKDMIVIEYIETTKETYEEDSSAKKEYNNKVKIFNQHFKAFPYTIIAKMAGGSEKKYFSKTSQ